MVARIHGMSKGGKDFPEYKAWQGMKYRCLNPKSNRYANYGARGITICDRWINSFENFLADMGEKPPNTSIDRIDNNGNYEPSNCRWATLKEQMNNKSNVLFFEGKTCEYWAAKLGTTRTAIVMRLRRNATVYTVRNFKSNPNYVRQPKGTKLYVKTEQAIQDKGEVG